jgi:hypothetical protein
MTGTEKAAGGLALEALVRRGRPIFVGLAVADGGFVLRA